MYAVTTKQYDELTFSDAFMFAKIMRNERICKSVLEIILNIKIQKIDYLETEKTIDINKFAKGIRLDVYVEDDNNTVFNLEMQVEKNKNIPKRSRFYQDIIDLNTLEKGGKYDTLKESYVIFICLFDLFDKGNYIYTFENMCHEVPGLKLNDGKKTIFVNATGLDGNITNELKSFLSYISGKGASTKLTNEIDTMVSNAKYNFNWRQEYMSLDLLIREQIEAESEEARKKALIEGRKQGLAEGRAKGHAEGRAEGHAEGHAEGRAEGRAEGHAEGRAEGRAEGHAEGRAEGRAEGELTSLNIIKLLNKGKSSTEIAKELNYNIDDVEKIIKLYNQ